jgi:hypothetical protein
VKTDAAPRIERGSANRFGEPTMNERVKVFTFVSGHGEMVTQPPHEDPINQWLAATRGRLVQVSQSESERSGASHHITVCLWYVPEEQS